MNRRRFREALAALPGLIVATLALYGAWAVAMALLVWSAPARGQEIPIYRNGGVYSDLPGGERVRIVINTVEGYRMPILGAARPSGRYYLPEPYTPPAPPQTNVSVRVENHVNIYRGLYERPQTRPYRLPRAH